MGHLDSPRIENTKLDDAGTDTSPIDEIHSEARHAVDAEHRLSLPAALRLYPQSAGWSIFFSLGVIMCAFDPQLLGQLYATPAFQRDFGYWYKVRMGSPIGQVVGALAAGYPMDWYGRKKTFGACVLLTSGIIFIQFFARSLPVLLVGELLGGLVLGSYAVIAPAYASEVCPVALRGTLTSYVNLCFVAGQLLANGVVAGTQHLESHWAYSIPFAVQWVWPAVVLVGLPWAPESPWWLVRVGRVSDAEGSLRRLASSKVDIKPAVAMIVETERLETEIQAGSTYRDLFRKINRRRTEISVGVYVLQVLSGVYLVSYATYFFELAGLPTTSSFNLGIIFLCAGFLGTALSLLILIPRFGRRSLYLGGLLTLSVLQFLIAILDCLPSYPSTPSLPYAQAILMIAWNFIYDATLGPVCFVLLCEVSSSNLRAKTIAFATAIQAAAGIGMTIAIPYLVNPDEAGLRGKVGWMFGGLAAIGFVWAWERVPETRGKTYEEIDGLFAEGVRARHFGRS
ncbi:MAG: hypothetical protein Q9227_001092 [Pyrenula ochraceoflavens]